MTRTSFLFIVRNNVTNKVSVRIRRNHLDKPAYVKGLLAKQNWLVEAEYTLSNDADYLAEDLESILLTVTNTDHITAIELKLNRLRVRDNLAHIKAIMRKREAVNMITTITNEGETV